MKQLTGPDSAERVLEEPDRIERSQPLQAGFYWRAKKTLKDDRVPKGCVLLLQRIKRVDDKPHGVELAGHPLLHPESTFEYLVGEFLDLFEPEPNGPAIRATEMGALRMEIDAKQNDLLSFQASPSALLAEIAKHPALPAPKRHEEKTGLPTTAFDPAAGLPGTSFTPGTSLVELATAGASVDLLRRRAENQAILAKKRAEMIEAKTKAIAETVGKLTPFYNEMGAVALAQSEDALDVYRKLKSGIMTLGLYTGKDVELIKVRDGAPAAADAKVVIFQALLFMDEESLIRVEEGGAQFGDFEEFAAKLAVDDALLERVLPVERGIVAMRYVHEKKEHDESTPALMAAMIDIENSKSFLIIRNGARVHIVKSSLDNLDRLYPTQSDFDEPFTRSGWWHGVESERITVADFEFSDARKSFDALVLHYRRLLILIAGLVDREPDVLGEIAGLRGKTGLAMLSLAVQEEVFLSISDEERALASGRPDFWAWLGEKNSVAISGSRLLCLWDELATPTTAPGFVKSGERDRDYWIAEPLEDSSIVIARREADALVVDCPVKSKPYRKEREFNARVNVSAYKRDRRDDLGFLCLDDVTPEEINYYIARRHGRRGYMEYVRLLFAAKRVVEADASREAPLRRTLIDAMMAGGVRIHGAEDSRAVATVIRTWRAAHRGAPVPMEADEDHRREWDSMARQLWVLAGKGRDRRATAEEIAAAEGRKPLRLALSGKTKLYLYATPTAEERCELLGPHRWVARLTLEELKTKVSVVDRKQVLLPKIDAREHLLVEWDGVAEHIDPELDHPLSYEEARDLPQLGEFAIARAREWLGRQTDVAFATNLERVKADTEERSRSMIEHGSLFIPLLILRGTRKEEHWEFDDDWPLRGGKRQKQVTLHHRYYVGGIRIASFLALALNATPKQRARIVDWFRDYYSKPSHAIERLDECGPLFDVVTLGALPAIKRATFDSRSVMPAKKKRSWEKDLVEAVKSAKAGPASYRSNDSAEIVLRFDDAAREVYALLAGPGPKA